MYSTASASLAPIVSFYELNFIPICVRRVQGCIRPSARLSIHANIRYALNG